MCQGTLYSGKISSEKTFASFLAIRKSFVSEILKVGAFLRDQQFFSPWNSQKNASYLPRKFLATV